MAQTCRVLTSLGIFVVVVLGILGADGAPFPSYDGPQPGIYCSASSGAAFLTIWTPGQYEIAYFNDQCNIVGAFNVDPVSGNFTFVTQDGLCVNTSIAARVLDPSRMDESDIQLTVTSKSGPETFVLAGGLGNMSTCTGGNIPRGDYCALHSPSNRYFVMSVDEGFGYTLNELSTSLPGIAGSCRASGSVWRDSADALYITIYGRCGFGTGSPFGQFQRDVLGFGEIAVPLALGGEWGTWNANFTRGACESWAQSDLSPSGSAGTFVHSKQQRGMLPAVVVNAGELDALLGVAASAYQLSIFDAEGNIYAARGAMKSTDVSSGRNFSFTDNGHQGGGPYNTQFKIDSLVLADGLQVNFTDLRRQVQHSRLLVPSNALSPAALFSSKPRQFAFGHFVGAHVNTFTGYRQVVNLDFNVRGLGTYKLGIIVPNHLRRSCFTHGHYAIGETRNGTFMYFSSFTSTCEGLLQLAPSPFMAESDSIALWFNGMPDPVTMESGPH